VIIRLLSGIANNFTASPDYVIANTLKPGHRKFSFESSFQKSIERNLACVSHNSTQQRIMDTGVWHLSVRIIMATLCNRGAIIFLPCGYYLFSSPNLSGRRLDVYHTSTHGVAL